MTSKKAALGTIALVLMLKLTGAISFSEDAKTLEPTTDQKNPAARSTFKDGICTFEDKKSYPGEAFVLLYELEEKYLTGFLSPLGTNGPDGPFRPERLLAQLSFLSEDSRPKVFRAQGYVEQSGMISASLKMKVGTLLLMLENPYALNLNFMSVVPGKRRGIEIDLEDQELKTAFDGFRTCVAEGGA